MNTCKSDKKDLSEDFSHASTSSMSDYSEPIASTSGMSSDYSESIASTSRILSNCSINDDEDSTSDDDISILQEQLGRLRVTYCKKKLENTVFKRCIEVKNVADFMNNLFYNEELKDSISEEQKETIKELYRKNRELCKKVKNVEKINKVTIKEVFNLHVQVQELMEERKNVWDEAVRIHKLISGDPLETLNTYMNAHLSSQVNENSKEKENSISNRDKEILSNLTRIKKIARILYSLIINSEVQWSTDENLLEVLECTSKMLDNDFDIENLNQFIKTLDEITSRLNKIKI